MASFCKIITMANFMRIYVVFVVSSLMVLNNLVYLTWSPIANVAMKVYGWNEDVIYLLNHISCYLIVPLSLVSSWFIETRGK